MDDGVASHLNVNTDICVGRIDKRNSTVDHQAAYGAPAQNVLELGQVGARIDAGNLAGIRMKVDFHRFAFAAQNLRHVGKIVLALLVDGLNAIERFEERPRFKTIESRVYLANLPLVC